MTEDGITQGMAMAAALATAESAMVLLDQAMVVIDTARITIAIACDDETVQAGAFEVFNQWDRLVERFENRLTSLALAVGVTEEEIAEAQAAGRY